MRPFLSLSHTLSCAAPYVGPDLLSTRPSVSVYLLTVLYNSGGLAHQTTGGLHLRGGSEENILHSTRACSQRYGPVV